jgi:hypothetical protein
MKSTLAYGTATNPSAGGTVAATGTLPSGRYTVVVTTRPTGTVQAGDLDNVQLQAGAAVIGTLLQNATAGSAVTSAPVTVEFTTAAAISVTAVANASQSSAVYGAQIVATPEALF